MRFRDDNRAVTVQVGAILLFATIVIALAMYQATVVPSQNADVEYKHSQTVQNQLADVRNAILRSAASGTTQPVSVTLGTQYPSRAFLMNPPPATGTLRTQGYDDDGIRVGNVEATNGETNDFFDAAASGWNASTKYLEYAPNYHEYDDAPNVVYGETLLYNYYVRANTTIPLTDQLLVNGNTVTLVALNGSMSTTQAGSVSVSPQGLSAPYERVQVTNDTAGPVTVTVPTLLSADAVAERTGIGSQSTVREVEPAGDGRVRIVLDPGTYTLRTAKVGVGGGATDPGPAYVTTADGPVVRTNETFTVSVRDRFNNPVTDQRVTVSVNDSSVVAGDASKPTTEDGGATFTYTGTGEDVAVSILGGGSPELTVTFDGRARSTGGGTGGGAYDLVWDTDTIDDQSGVSYYSGNDTVVVDADVAASPIDMTTRSLSHGGAPLSGVFVDYASGNTAVADFEPSEDNTGNDGRSTVLMPYASGRTTVYASSVGDSDSVDVEIYGEDAGKAQNVEITQVQIDDGQVVAQFRNDNPSSVTFERVRLDSYSEANPPNNPNREAIDRVIYRPGIDGVELVEGDPLEGVTGPTISNGGNQGVTLQPQRIDNTGGGPSIVDADAQSGDELTLTIEFDDGSVRQYTVTL